MHASLSSLSLLDRAVLVTVAYTDQFSYPLILDEVVSRCLIQEIPRGVSINEIEQSLKRLIQRHFLESLTLEHDTFFFLPGRKGVVSARKRAEAAAAEKQHEIQTVLTFLKKLPCLSAVYITGSQAMNSATLQSDIDFMMITTPNRLWLTRVIVSLFAQLHGKRRSWNKEEPGSWCFNLWLDADHLQVHSSKQDSYRAYEVYQAQLLYDRDHVAEKFLQENAWVSTYLNAYSDGMKSTSQKQQRSTGLFNQFFSGIDWIAWKIQEAYMARHRTVEKVGRGFAFFHPRDTGRMIQDGWLNSLERCLSKDAAAEILQPYVRSPDST
jgi:predicted nucleotidyltransferase